MKTPAALLSFFSLTVFTTAALAGPTCTNEPRENWMPPAEVLAKATVDVPTMKVFKVTKGHCYEIYGWGPNREKLEIYYHPITGKEVKRGSW